MARHIIAYEGREMVIGQILLPGSVKWPEDGRTIPVTESADWSRFPIGRAGEFRREEDGSITAEINVDVPEGLSTTVYMSDVETQGTDDIRMITSGRLRAVFMTKDVPW